MKQVLGLQQLQTQKLNQQMQQSLQILQLSRLDLAQLLQQKLETNPFLILQSAEDEWHEHSQSEEEIAHVEEVAPFEADDLLNNNDLFSSEYFESHANDAIENNDNEELNYINHIAAPSSFQETLAAQVINLVREPWQRMAFNTVLYSLNESGFLSEPLEQLVSVLQKQVNAPADQATLYAQLSWAQQIIQNCQPIGLACKDIYESLQVQLEHLEPKLDQTLLKACEQLLNWMRTKQNQNSMRNLSQLSRVLVSLNIPVTMTSPIIAALRRCTLYPARELDTFHLQSIEPDVVVRFQNSDSHQLQILYNTRYLPQCVFDNTLFKQLDKSAKNLKQLAKEAEQLVTAIQQRQHTLVKVCNLVLQQQVQFFVKGKLGITPLLMREVSEKLNLHASTISRAVADKYIDSPFGIIPLRIFFSQSTSTDSELSTIAMQENLRKVIDQEDPNQPLSDEQLCKALEQVSGQRVARRTINKYRYQLGISAAHERKAQYKASA